MILYAAATILLLHSFINSFADNRLQKDIQSAITVHSISSGKILSPIQQPQGSNHVIIVVRIDRNGIATPVSDLPAEIKDHLKGLRFEPVRINGQPIESAVPIMLSEK